LQINIEYDRDALSTLYDQISNIIGGAFSQRLGGNYVQFYQTDQQHGQTVQPNKYMWDLTRKVIYGSMLFFGSYCNLIPRSMDDPSTRAPMDMRLCNFWKLISRKSRKELYLCHMIFTSSDFHKADLPLYTGFGGVNQHRIFSLLFARLVDGQNSRTLLPMEEHMAAYKDIIRQHVAPYANQSSDLLILPQGAFRRWETQMLPLLAMTVVPPSDQTHHFFDNPAWAGIFAALVLRVQKENAPRRELFSANTEKYKSVFVEHIVPNLNQDSGSLPVQSFLNWQQAMLPSMAVVLKPSDFREGLMHKYCIFQTESWNLVFSACLHQQKRSWKITDYGNLFCSRIGPHFNKDTESFVLPCPDYLKWKQMSVAIRHSK
jgi:hypothetical protein